MALTDSWSISTRSTRLNKRRWDTSTAFSLLALLLPVPLSRDRWWVNSRASRTYGKVIKLTELIISPRQTTTYIETTPAKRDTNSHTTLKRTSW